MAATLDYDTFAKELNTKFQIQINPEQTLEAELVDISEHLISKRQDRFAIVFRTSNDVFLGQGMCDFHHDRMGDFTLFITAIGRDKQGTSYEAVFNRLIKNGTGTFSATLRTAGNQTITATAPLDSSKHLFDPQDVLPNAFVESVRPSLIIFPNVAERALSSVRPLSQPEVMATLICLCPWASFDRVTARGHLDALSSLVRNCTAYRLEVGSDLFGDAEATASFVATLC